MRAREHEIMNGFDALRKVCDPRGYALLDALERLCVFETRSLDSILVELDHLERHVPSTNVVPLIRDYSVKA